MKENLSKKFSRSRLDAFNRDDDAINRDFSYEEVLEELRDNSDRAWGIDMDSSDAEMLQEQLRKFSPPQSGE